MNALVTISMEEIGCRADEERREEESVEENSKEQDELRKRKAGSQSRGGPAEKE